MYITIAEFNAQADARHAIRVLMIRYKAGTRDECDVFNELRMILDEIMNRS